MTGKQLKIWLVHFGETPQVEPGKDRAFRVGLLAQKLAARRVDVVWWSSTFEHARKRHLFDRETAVRVAPSYEIHLLEGRGYQRNVSLGRMLDHWQLGRRFAAVAARYPAPDLVFCTLPTVELAARGVAYARAHRIPSVVDVRDLWPEIFLDVLPSALRPLGRLALHPLFRDMRAALRECDVITGVSEPYLDWGLRNGGKVAGPPHRVFPLGFPRTRAVVDTENGRRAVIARGVDPAKTIVWFAGALGRTYDLGTPIEAMRTLERIGVENLQLVISGDGDKAEEWRRQASGSSNVVFTGWIGPDELEAMMSMAKVGLAAYAAGAPQTHPNKYFEYMHAGLPIVSSLKGPGADILRDLNCGLSYEPGDVDGLATVLHRLATDARHRETLSRNSASAFDRYDADKIIEEMADFLIEGASGAWAR